jgi:adenylate cyclase
MKISKQYERKFLIKELPDLSTWEKEEIQQWYITPPSNNLSTRIRQYSNGNIYFDNIYSKGKIREKNGFKIHNPAIIETFKNYPSIKKTRYKNRENNDVLMIVDIYENDLMIAEIETYKSEEIIDNFNLPDWFGDEVTDDIKYSNNWLVYNFHF